MRIEWSSAGSSSTTRILYVFMMVPVDVCRKDSRDGFAESGRDQLEELLVVERLAQRGNVGDAPQPALEVVAMTGDEDQRDVGGLTNFFREFDAVPVGHVQVAD